MKAAPTRAAVPEPFWTAFTTPSIRPAEPGMLQSRRQKSGTLTVLPKQQISEVSGKDLCLVLSHKSPKESVTFGSKLSQMQMKLETVSPWTKWFWVWASEYLHKGDMVGYRGNTGWPGKTLALHRIDRLGEDSFLIIWPNLVLDRCCICQVPEWTESNRSEPGDWSLGLVKIFSNTLVFPTLEAFIKVCFSLGFEKENRGKFLCLISRMQQTSGCWGSVERIW